MTILDIIIAIYILGVFFNFGTIFEDAMFLYTYQSIVKKQERKKLGI